MKKLDEWFALIFVILVLIFGGAITYTIAESNLPFWIKFALLNR